ncbi:hypothetical protein EJB05_25469 [Eragrostis curvula]|uniref:Uncharacterized protein n=1 Tax=Eragrostis curvula TaxID=38414 RepID=A0A5J9VBZ0_9POAL|nr:hypothetical protein EJB05_25469 [Eragrostis curvula]
MLIFLFSGQQQQQVAAAPFDYCKCYRHCYSDCRDWEHHPRWLCCLRCLNDCSGAAEHAFVSASAGDCNGICRPLSFCGTAANGADDVEACVEDCTNNLGAYAPTTADLN